MTSPLLNAAQPITRDDGTMEQAFRQWTQDAALSIPDSTGSAGSIQYRKMLPDIGGDRSQGWLLV